MNRRLPNMIQRGVVLTVAALFCCLHTPTRAQQPAVTPSVADAPQDLRQGSSRLLVAVREAVLAQALADEQRSKNTGSYTSVSFPLPTCVFEGGLCGAINRDGSIAVPPQYDWVDNFHEGRARVRWAGRYGFVDTEGRVVVEPRYEIAGAYRRGYAEVDVDGKSALIDPEGREVLAPRFGRAQPFTRDVFWVLEGTRHYSGRPGMAEFAHHVGRNITHEVVVGRGKWGLVDRSGAWIHPPEFSVIQFFDGNDDSLMLVKAESWWGVIKPDGSWHIEPKFESLGVVSRLGPTPAQVGGKSGYVNRDGAFEIEPRFDRTGYFSEDGLARAEIGKRYGLIDRAGNWVVEPKYEFLAHGLASFRGLIWFRDGKLWGAIDRAGRLVVKPQFHQLGATICDDGWVIGYVDGKRHAVRREDAPLAIPAGELATPNCEQPIRIQRNGKFGYLDRMLNPITEIKFDEAADFHHDVAAVELNGSFGYINRDGTWLIEPRFEAARPMLNDVATVKLDGKFGCIKRDGTWLIEPRFAQAPLSCGYLIATIPARFGFEKPDGTWHIDPQFEGIGGFAHGFNAIKLNGKYGVVDSSGAWVIEPRWRSYATAISGGLVGVRIDEKWGFMDASGALMIDANYEAFPVFARGIAWVKTASSTWCAIDRSGRNVPSLACRDADPNPKPGTFTGRGVY